MSQCGASFFSRVVRTTTSSALINTSEEYPSVKDVCVNLNIVDASGARRKIVGLVGKTVYDVCSLHGVDLGPTSVGGKVEAKRSEVWTEPLFGEGPTCGYDHVLLTGNGVDTADLVTSAETKMLQHYWDPDEIFPESRLACMVTLTKAMDGMTVYVPDRIVDDIP